MMGKAERTRQFIIETAAPIFNQKGIAGVSIDNVLAATKVAKGCLYGHFDSKEELSYAVVDFILERLNERLTAVTNKPKSGKLKLFAYLDYFSNPMEFPLTGGCPMINFGMEADDTNVIVKKKVKISIEKVQKILTTIIEQGVESGEFVNTWDAREFVIKTFSLIQGAIMVCRILENNSQMKTIIKLLKQDIEAHLL